MRVFATAGLLLGAALSCVAGALLAGGIEAQAAPAATGESPHEPAGVPAKLSEAQVIAAVDGMIEDSWKARGLTPSKPVDDGKWLRRVSLDLLGRAPTAGEIALFLADKQASDKKRDATIASMLVSPEYAANSSYIWMRALIGGDEEGKRGSGFLRRWLDDSVRGNMRYDAMVRDLVTATGQVTPGEAESASAAGFLISFENETNNIASAVSRAFLGIEIQCAQCHDHPYESWKQADFTAFAALFRGTRTSVIPTSVRTFSLSDLPTRTIGGRRGEKIEERMGERMKDNPKAAERLDLMRVEPKLLGGAEVTDARSGADLRRALARWITAPDNPWFARTAVNRLWGHFLKRGFVEPVDDFNTVNTPTNPQLLALLANDFRDNGYDLRRLTRIILHTRAYQLSSELSDNNKDDNISYSRAYLDQLDARLLFNSLLSVTQVERSLDRTARRQLDRVRQGALRQFRVTFEDDEGKDKESFSGTIPQALMMMNGELLATAVSARHGTTLMDIIDGAPAAEERVERMVLAALCRKATMEEKRRFVDYIKGEGGVVAAYEDVFWALLNSAEFLNNH